VWSSKGFALSKLGRHDEAIEALQTAVRLSPDFVNGWVNLGHAYLLKRQLGESITALQRALQLRPQSADAMFYLAQAYAGSNQYELAKQQAEAVLMRTPDFVPALYLAGGVYVILGNTEAALATYAKLKSTNPALAGKFVAEVKTLGARAKVQLPD